VAGTRNSIQVRTAIGSGWAWLSRGEIETTTRLHCADADCKRRRMRTATGSVAERGRRERLLQVAEAILAHGGEERLQMKQLAERAGIAVERHRRNLKRLGEGRFSGDGPGGRPPSCWSVSSARSNATSRWPPHYSASQTLPSAQPASRSKRSSTVRTHGDRRRGPKRRPGGHR
jgi:hypothetical protein